MAYSWWCERCRERVGSDPSRGALGSFPHSPPIAPASTLHFGVGKDHILGCTGIQSANWLARDLHSRLGPLKPRFGVLKFVGGPSKPPLRGQL